MDAVWYRRALDIPENFKGKRVILHFGAVDHKAYVYVNGALVGTHTGGYWPFQFDITDYLKSDGNYVTVHCRGRYKKRKVRRGKSRAPDFFRTAAVIRAQRVFGKPFGWRL